MTDSENSVSFLPPEPERTLSLRTWGIAALAVVLALGIASIATLKHAPTDSGAARTADVYAGSLPISGITMAEATNGAGGKLTYVDGTISNTGTKTVKGATVQVTFATEDGTPPHRETLLLSLIRTRVPYVDLQPVSAAPIAPGTQQEFRLIFETVPANWDVRPPLIQIIHADLR
jgi:hypothetical protein